MLSFCGGSGLVSRRSGVEWFRLRKDDRVEVEATETLGDAEVEIEFDVEDNVVVDDEGTGTGLFEYDRGVLLVPTAVDDDASWRVKDSRLPRAAPD